MRSRNNISPSKEGDMNCRFCGRDTVQKTTRRVINNYELFNCPECQSIGILNSVNSDEVTKNYDELFAKGEYEQHRNEFELIKMGRNTHMPYRKLLLSYLRLLCNGKKVLEIGGGTGAFGVYAKSKGWDYLDIDISEVAIEFATRLGLKAQVIPSTKPFTLPEKEFDLVVMWEVLEHIYDVNDYLNAILTTLQPGGYFLFSTPNYYRKSYQSNDFGPLGSPPIHINFFTSDGIKNLLEITGFVDVKVYKRRLFTPSKWSYTELKRSVAKLLGIEESPTLICIARKQR